MKSWNAGRRIAHGYDAELRRLTAERDALATRDRELRAQYGTRWPREIVDEFVSRERELQRDYALLDDLQNQFPCDLFAQIEDALAEISCEDHPELPQQLREAVGRLMRARAERSERGSPILDSRQRTRLAHLDRCLLETLRACGQVAATARLIGGCAEAGGLADLANAAANIRSQTALKLSRQPPARRHRPRDQALAQFCQDVVVALIEAGEPVKVYRNGAAERIIRLLLEAADLRAPRDLLRRISAAKKAAAGAITVATS